MNMLIPKPTVRGKTKLYSLITVMALAVSTFTSLATPTPATAADYSAPLNTTTQLSGYSVNSSISGTVRVVLRSSNPSALLSVSTFTGLVGIRNTFNYGNLGTSGQMIGFAGTAANINSALATLSYNSSSTGTDSISMWVSNGTEYIPIINGSSVEFHYYVFRDDAATPDAAAAMATAVGAIDGQTGVTTYLATLRYQVEDVFASQIMVAWGNRDQAWIAAKDDVAEGQWRWFGPDANGVQFWNGDNSGIYSVNGEYWNWGRTAASSGLQRPISYAGKHCMMLNASSSYTYGLVRMNGGNNYWYGWHNGLCSYGTKWMYEALVQTKPAGQNTNVAGSTYSMTPVVKTVSIATPPDQPTGLTSSANPSGNVELSWAAPSNTGTDPLTDYTVEYSQSSTFASGVSNWSHTASTQTSVSISGLTAGTTYYFRVAAVSSMAGAFSSTSTLMLPRLPSAPQSLTGTPRDQFIDLAWSAPSDNGGSTISGYKVEYKASTSGTWTTASSSVSGNSYQLTSLTNGTNYDVRVSATNGFWGTLATTSSIKPFGAVSNTAMPTVGGANAAGEILTGADGSWDTNGAAVTSTTYQWQSRSNPSDSWSNISGANSSTYVLTSNDVGKYLRLQVSKTNGANSNAYVSASSTSTSVIQAGLASTPGSLSGVFGNQSVQVSWTIPASNGGTISGFRVEYSTDGDNWTLSQLVSASATSHTITGLTNGTSYFVRVTGVTAAGNGAYAISSDAVIPSTTPTNTSLPTVSGQSSYGSVLSASAGSWNANGRALGAANYQWQYSTDSGLNWNDLVGEISDQLTINGNIGALLRVKVTRSNSVGATNAYSTATSAVTASSATGPQNVSVVPGDQGLSVTWAAPSNTGGVSLTDYQIQYSTDAVTWTTVSRSASLTTSQQISSLTNGTSYYVRVRALNGLNGAWAFSGTTQAPRGLPIVVIAPTISGTSSYQQLLTTNIGSWNTNGASITSTTYQWQRSVDGNTWVDIAGANTNEYRVTTAIGNRIRLKVSQTNSVGSTESITSATNAVAAVNAAAPAVVLRETGDSQFTIRWSAPSHNGGVALTGYTVEYSTDQTTWTSVNTASSATEAIVTGATNGQTYYARVRAETDRHGEWSTILGPIRPAAPVVPVVSTPPARINTNSPVVTARQVTAIPLAITDWSILQNVMPVPIAAETIANSPAQVTPDGRIELQPSTSVILVNGQAARSAVLTEQGSTAVAQNGSTLFNLVFASNAGLAQLGDVINFSGAGFTPGSPIVVWIQSTPTKLKEVVTDSSGSESTQFKIPSSLTPGQHTLQINGVDAQGNVVSFAYGITVKDTTISTEEGSKNNNSQQSVPILLISLFLLGLLILLLAIIWMRRARRSP
jgi:hypothetical protein